MYNDIVQLQILKKRYQTLVMYSINHEQIELIEKISSLELPFKKVSRHLNFTVHKQE